MPDWRTRAGGKTNRIGRILAPLITLSSPRVVNNALISGADCAHGRTRLEAHRYENLESSV
jgi:hypothetical protein